MRLHPWCEAKGCGQPSTECHHTAKRGAGGHNRDKSPLMALCFTHHREAEGERITTPLDAPSSLRWLVVDRMEQRS